MSNIDPKRYERTLRAAIEALSEYTSTCETLDEMNALLAEIEAAQLPTDAGREELVRKLEIIAEDCEQVTWYPTLRAAIEMIRGGGAVPDGFEFPYMRTFNAIKAAVNIERHREVAISVQVFQDSFNGVKAAAPAPGEILCSDCPPADYATDDTRCAPCPRRKEPR